MDSFEVFPDHELKIIRVAVVGEMLQNDGEEVITAARKAALESGYDILYDIRQATTKIPFASWFHMPRNLEVYKDLNNWRIKAAVLASTEDNAVKDYKFYETVTNNLGLKMRLFFDKNDALDWLMKDRPLNQ